MILTSHQRDGSRPTAMGLAGTLQTVAWRALGTECRLQFVAPDKASADTFATAAQQWVARFELRYSRFLPSSELSRINAAAGRTWIEIDEEMSQMLDLSGSLHFMTQGVLDVTSLPLLRLWDFRAPAPRIPADAAIAEARKLVGWGKVQRAPGKVFLPTPGMALDFGGWGKEFAVDAVAQIAAAHGITAVLADFGHDLRALGLPPGKPAWHIGLEDPKAPGNCWGSVAVTDRGVASSGDYVRSFVHEGRRYGHIVDPRTGWPVSNGCLQVTVIAPTCLQAGVLSTAAFVLGAEAGVRLIQETFGADGCILTTRARHQTRGFFNYLVESRGSSSPP